MSSFCVQEKFKAVVWESQAYKKNPAEMEALWNSCSHLLYSLEDKQKQLGLGDEVSLLLININILSLFITLSCIICLMNGLVFFLSFTGYLHVLLRELLFKRCRVGPEISRLQGAIFRQLLISAALLFL